MDSNEHYENVGRLVEIQQEMLELLNEAQKILYNYPDAKRRAKAYWLAHIKCALVNDHGYLGGSMCTMEDTIVEIEEEGPEQA